MFPYFNKPCRILLWLLILCSLPCSYAEDEVEPTPSSPKLGGPVVKGSINLAKRGLSALSKITNPKVMVIPVNDAETSKDGMIDEWQANFIEHRLQRAENEKFDLVVLEIDTYGGSVHACERINRAIAQCKVPVIAYVKEKAFSGGALLSLGCKAIVMEPGSRIGGAKAIVMGMELTPSERQKMDSNMRAMVTNLCDANHYPDAIAIGMVNSESEIIETADSKHRFVTAEGYDNLHPQPTKISTLKGKGTILTLTAQEAMNVGLASGIVAEDDLYTALGFNFQNVTVERADITSSEVVARFLSHPIWRVLLVIIGLIALFIEMKAPGHGVGYIVFALCLGMVFWLHFFADGANLLEVALFACGVLLIGLEVFVFPTIGMMLFAGFVLVLLSIVLAFLSPSVSLLNVFTGKASYEEVALVGAGLKWASITAATIVTIVITALARGTTLPGLSRLTLRAESGSTAYPEMSMAAGAALSATGELAKLIGKQGSAETMLRPSGKIRLDGATYDAISEGAFIDPGSNVIVLRIRGGSLVVRAKESA